LRDGGACDDSQSRLDLGAGAACVAESGGIRTAEEIRACVDAILDKYDDALASYFFALLACRFSFSVF
jgi:hypothetical protein